MTFVEPTTKPRSCSAREHERGEREVQMAQTRRGRAQDRKRVAGGQEHEFRYETRKTDKTKVSMGTPWRSIGSTTSVIERPA